MIPGGEIFLPAWVMIFPNSIPSQFVADDEREKKFREMLQRQENSAQKLEFTYPRYIQRLLNSNEVIESDKEKLVELKGLL